MSIFLAFITHANDCQASQEIRDANFLAIFISREIGESGIAFFHSSLCTYLMYPHKETSLDVKNMLELDNHLSCHKHPSRAGLTEFNLV